MQGRGKPLNAVPPPRPVASVTKVERPGRLVLRLGRVAAYRMNRRGWPLTMLLFGVGSGYFGIGMVFGLRGSPAPLVAVMFICIVGLDRHRRLAVVSRRA